MNFPNCLQNFGKEVSILQVMQTVFEEYIEFAAGWGMLISCKANILNGISSRLSSEYDFWTPLIFIQLGISTQYANKEGVESYNAAHATVLQKFRYKTFLCK